VTEVEGLTLKVEPASLKGDSDGHT
jgi:hypothetical protein